MTDQPTLHDYNHSRAVVMGTSKYDFLEPIPPAKNSMHRMTELLSGPLCGWPHKRLEVIENERNPGDLYDRLITAFADCNEIALFYYVGHGQVSPDDQLCLGLVRSRPEAHRRAATSLRFSDVRQALLESNARIKLVILDCCFAGLATIGTLAGQASDVLDLTAGAGAYTIAASSPYSTAWYETAPGQSRPQTYFTKCLVDLVQEGMPGQASRLCLDELYRKLHDNLVADHHPVPRKRAVDDARGFFFAYNAAPPHTHFDPELELTRLSQQLAKANAQLQELEAKATERTRQLAHLKDLLLSPSPLTAKRRRELHEAIDVASTYIYDMQSTPENPGDTDHEVAAYIPTTKECIDTLQRLVSWLRWEDYFPNKSVSFELTDLDMTFISRITPEGAQPIRQATPEDPRADLRLKGESSTLFRTAESPNIFPQMWLKGKIKVQASMRDLLTLRRML